MQKNTPQTSKVNHTFNKSKGDTITCAFMPLVGQQEGQPACKVMPQ